MKRSPLVEQIEIVLDQVPETRNSDIRLTQEVWKKFYPHEVTVLNDELWIKLDALWSLPREDHVKRVRAVIQNEERRYLPTDIDVFIARARASDEWREFLGYNKSWDKSFWRKAIEEFVKGSEQGSLF